MRRLITKKEVCQKIGYARATLDRWTNEEEYEHIGFPKPVPKLSKRLWDEREVDDWILKMLDTR